MSRAISVVAIVAASACLSACSHTSFPPAAGIPAATSSRSADSVFSASDVSQPVLPDSALNYPWKAFETSNGVLIAFPGEVALEEYNGNAVVSVSAEQHGEVVSFLRDGLDTPVSSTPYWPPRSDNFPAQLFVADVVNERELAAFVQRAYGRDCRPGRPSTIEGRTFQSFTVEAFGPDCPGQYPVGDVVRWDEEHRIAIGIQPTLNKLYRTAAKQRDGVALYQPVAEGFLVPGEENPFDIDP